ncbi:hypothetical protein ACFQXB_13545 [Plastorhodobacter daqingensis]|uniref:Uncharacterized protein n=1 Tax=Plastorhodobacter daqingensis TaxID=1387281 RepID=A0ABW2UKK2_9RHOB
MTTMAMPRKELKAACLALLDRHAVEHPAGPQGKLVARYLLRSTSGERVSLMFEKHEKTKPHLWLEHRLVVNRIENDIEARFYPAAALHRAIVSGKTYPRPSVGAQGDARAGKC